MNNALRDYEIDSFGGYRRSSPTETYAIYLAYTETHHGHGLLKVGLTVEPYRRLYEVYLGCPFPLITFIWGWVGCKANAFQFETASKRGLKEEGRHLRGEWFHWDAPHADDFPGDRITEIRHRLRMHIGGHSVDWKDGDIAEVVAFHQANRAKKAKDKAKKPARRKKPWESWR